ncbi:MAG: FAD-dependent oxidoreductase [Candidatus Altiarchaeota archaeon]|nr:FAD-dependent oxidoreductase [Candidatus Altiarchaeota archaeon]
MGRREPMKIAVVGCGDAGLSAAFAAAKQDPNSEVIIISDETSYYPRCPLPYFIGGSVKEKELVYDLRRMFKGTNIKAVNDTVLRVTDGFLECKDGKITFDKAIIATGGIARRIGDSITLRTLEDAKRIKKAAEESDNIVFLGGGMLGCELADVLGGTLLEKQSHILPNFDKKFADAIASKLNKKGVRIITNSERTPKADLVVSCVGVDPDLELAVKSGIKTSRFGINVNDRLETSIKNVYAAGDCIEEKCLITGVPMHSYLGPQAEREGVIAGVNAAGGNMYYKGSLGAVVAKIDDIEIGRTGLCGEEAAERGVSIVEGMVRTKTKPAYDTTAKDLMIKMVFIQERLVGCQALGGEMIDGIINLASYAIQHNATIDDLINMTYCFSPPICSAPNPIILCAENAKRRSKNG